MALAEIVSPLVEAALVIAPELVDIPVLGRVLLALSGAKPLDDTKAIEQLQRQEEEAKKTRQKVRDRLGHRVIKVSDALDCVEKTLFDGRLLLLLGKAIIKTIAGTSTQVGSLQYDPIAQCMIQKMLSQSGKKTLRSWKQPYHRPAIGHGKGGFTKGMEGVGEAGVLLEKGVTEFIKELIK
jgi:hypothetical protein